MLPLAVGQLGVGGHILPSAADTYDLGSSALEWQDLYLGDAGKMYLGLGQEHSIADGGSGGLEIDSSEAISVESSGGAINVGADAVAQAINIGTGAAARQIKIGNVTGASALFLSGGTGGVKINSAGTGDIRIDSDDVLTLDADGVLELNSSAGAISIGNDAVAAAINVGTGAAARTITVGNATGATALNLASGTGNVTIGSTDAVTVDGAGVVELNSSAAAIGIGNDAVAQKISVGGDVVTRTEVELNAILVDVNAGSGGLTMDAAGPSNLTTSSGALTVTSAVACSWGTTAGNLTLASGNDDVVIDAAQDVLLDAANGDVLFRQAGTTKLTIDMADSKVTPADDNLWDLGSASKRFRNIYTGDLNLQNDRGNWTLIEESGYISFRNNDSGKRYKMLMEEVTGDGTYGPGNDGVL